MVGINKESSPARSMTHCPRPGGTGWPLVEATRPILPLEWGISVQASSHASG